ncbi:MAG: DUF4492 domain-containing protein [Desulfobulbaceae bacterium]|nr:DUF4492 domain-containing protein [Desulfobulbaceae bacterium]
MNAEQTKNNWLISCGRLYWDGFRSMTVGKTLWKIIFIKLFVMFAVLKLFFFPNFLKNTFATDEQRAEYVLHHLAPSEKNSEPAVYQK